MDIKLVMGNLYEFIFPKINTLIALVILILIVYGIYYLISKFRNRKKKGGRDEV